MELETTRPARRRGRLVALLASAGLALVVVTPTAALAISRPLG